MCLYYIYKSKSFLISKPKYFCTTNEAQVHISSWNVLQKWFHASMVWNGSDS